MKEYIKPTVSCLSYVSSPLCLSTGDGTVSNATQAGWTREKGGWSSEDWSNSNEETAE